MGKVHICKALSLAIQSKVNGVLQLSEAKANILMTQACIDMWNVVLTFWLLILVFKDPLLICGTKHV